jgi:signal transduction histidine kinase
MMKKNIDKITNLSMDLLNYAKTSRLDLASTHPDQPVKEIKSLLGLQAKQMGIDLKVTLLGKEDLCVMMDPGAIHTCIFNLTTNALDAFDTNSAPEHSRQVHIFVQQKDNTVVYQVQDNGMGMNKTIQQTVFTDFITTKGTRGTGFGLMTTKKIVEEHKGKIGFTTQEGKGSKFWIQLPLS